jgi:hypothetical protein
MNVEIVEVGYLVIGAGAAGMAFADTCALAFSNRPPRPIFEDPRITLQSTRHCSPTFSAAMIAHVEAAYGSDAEQNEICTVIPTPTDPLRWLQIMAADLPKSRYRQNLAPAVDNLQILLAETGAPRAA